ncbi:hypothetical protein [Oceanicola sp. 502str15]|uniref:hypothetical protein n=1 Tax=Oceanicola sp. 502str15 TaxID=2696061 RepID=UPI00209477D7|nr:hypothetical protein [Oceanicola sp. 502str15]MCO6384623.1 hypothetical protein [Oceanicola sp. 502str15]
MTASGEEQAATAFTLEDTRNIHRTVGIELAAGVTLEGLQAAFNYLSTVATLYSFEEPLNGPRAKAVRGLIENYDRLEASLRAVASTDFFAPIPPTKWRADFIKWRNEIEAALKSDLPDHSRRSPLRFFFGEILKLFRKAYQIEPRIWVDQGKGSPVVEFAYAFIQVAKDRVDAARLASARSTESGRAKNYWLAQSKDSVRQHLSDALKVEEAQDGPSGKSGTAHHGEHLFLSLLRPGPEAH